MRLVTKGKRPLKKSNADPRFSRAFMVYFYKTYSGKTEIRLFLKTQDQKTRSWKFARKGEIYKSGSATVSRIKKLMMSWEKPIKQ